MWLCISIHVPAWGTTIYMRMLLKSFIFQSTFPRGERRYIKCKMGFFKNFNPRSRVGNDMNDYDMDMIREEFQSTFPRGERQPYLVNQQLIDNFNPRSRVGNDLFLLPFLSSNTISIHVPAWGTTAKTYKFSIYIYTFLYKLVFFAI